MTIVSPPLPHPQYSENALLLKISNVFVKKPGIEVILKWFAHGVGLYFYSSWSLQGANRALNSVKEQHIYAERRSVLTTTPLRSWIMNSLKHSPTQRDKLSKRSQFWILTCPADDATRSRSPTTWLGLDLLTLLLVRSNRPIPLGTYYYILEGPTRY